MKPLNAIDTPAEELTTQEIAVRLREDINEFLPDSFTTSVNTSQSLEGVTITVTITHWPAEIPMLSLSHIFEERRAVLSGQVFEMSKTHHLSDQANLLVKQLQSLVDRYQTTVEDAKNFIGEVAFDRRALDVEKNNILQTLKESGASKKQMSLFPHQVKPTTSRFYGKF